jgi:osmotically-inducible protein OsmY
MERMSLGQRVEAGILNAKFDLRDIHVKVPERGTIRITGVVREDDIKERLIQLVTGMAGVSKVEDNVAVVSLFVD